MFLFLKHFLTEESGAVTVDWVVLTAFLASFGAGIALTISTAAQDPADGLGAQLMDIQITN